MSRRPRIRLVSQDTKIPEPVNLREKYPLASDAPALAVGFVVGVGLLCLGIYLVFDIAIFATIGQSVLLGLLALGVIGIACSLVKELW